MHNHNENRIKKLFRHKIPIENAVALLNFKKQNLTQELLHQLKYKGNEQVSYTLGNWLGENLKEREWAKKVDVIIPVPIHKRRKRKRGFNQVTGFGKNLAKHLQCEFHESVLLKKIPAKTQVFKSKYEREAIKLDWLILQKPEIIANKHVLLVDDIITTGSTLAACGEKLLEAKNVKISIATMAVTV
ncbi:ComF family protein [Mesonia sp. K7]|nr:ComF family protein [Mesonia sp. K7]